MPEEAKKVKVAMKVEEYHMLRHNIKKVCLVEDSLRGNPKNRLPQGWYRIHIVSHQCRTQQQLLYLQSSRGTKKHHR